MNPNAILALISDLYAQIAEQSARADRAEAALLGQQDRSANKEE
jgi:hypothetical protein